MMVGDGDSKDNGDHGDSGGTDGGAEESDGDYSDGSD